MGFLGSLFGSKPNFSNVKSPYQQVQAIYPNLSKLTTRAGDISGQLMSGNLPPDVANNIKDYGAAWGLSSGAGSGLGTVGGNLTLKDLGLSSLGQEEQGFNDYLKFLTGTGSQQMNPNLQAQIDQANAAPDPTYTGIMKLVGNLGGSVLGGVL